MEGPSEKLDRQWGMVREAQRQAWHTLEHVTVVPAADLALYDFIHNASEGNLVVGGTVRPRRAGRMLRARCGLDGAGAGIRGSDCPGHGDGSLFRASATGSIPFGVPAALLPFEAEDAQGLAAPKAYETGTDSLTITFERPLGADAPCMAHGA